MEKRALIRSHTQISVACSSLTSSRPPAVSYGIMLNCSCEGTCIELNQRINQGSILMIKATGGIDDIPQVLPECFRTLSLAEVKWLKLRDGPRAHNYMIGLKYLSTR